MKIKILSDLHLEFREHDLSVDDSDILILAGDIHTGEKGIDWISEKAGKIPVVYVLGNHEYYRNSYPKLLYKLKEKSKGTNIHILENESIDFSGVQFHGATLWTNFELFGDPRIAGFECQQKMNDYRLIRRDPSYSRLRSIDTFGMHNKSLNWLRESLNTSKFSTNIIVTHHAPSIKSVPDKYRNDLITSGFASNLEEFILETQPDLWVHGHIHESCDYSLNTTRILCNPKGYPGEFPSGFNSNLIVEIEEQ